MMVEILCAVLSGGAMSTALGGMYILERKMNTSQMFLAIDVARFLTLEEFRARMEQLVAIIKSTRPAQGYEEVMVAGDPELRSEATRLRSGIPLEESLWTRLSALAGELGVQVPELVG